MVKGRWICNEQIVPWWWEGDESSSYGRIRKKKQDYGLIQLQSLQIVRGWCLWRKKADTLVS